MKYIFPREFGLHNVFTSTVDPRETSQPLKDYTFRENEISAIKVRGGNTHAAAQISTTSEKSVKVPRRLRGMAVDLVRKLQNRNKACSYTELLRHYCPQEVNTVPSVNCSTF